MSGTLYTTEILRLATNIPHLGRLDAPDGCADKRSLTCGSKISVDVRLDDAGQVQDFAQMVSACALGQASACLLGRDVVGKNLAELEAARDTLRLWLKREADGPGDWQGLSVFEAARDYPARHAAILLPFDAVIEAIRKARR
jgi:NifU-like protein involved in Fe-S cluster formation